jgi:hypothetical protein
VVRAKGVDHDEQHSWLVRTSRGRFGSGSEAERQQEGGPGVGPSSGSQPPPVIPPCAGHEEGEEGQPADGVGCHEYTEPGAHVA